MTKVEGRKICLAGKRKLEGKNTAEASWDVGKFIAELRSIHGDPKVQRMMDYVKREGCIEALEFLMYNDF